VSKSWSDRESLDAQAEIPEGCPLCARRCPVCGHTLGRPWGAADKVRCHNCGADVGPAPVRLVKSDGGQDD
jgi:ribosomal protein S27E